MISFSQWGSVTARTPSCGWKLLTCKNYLHVGSLCQFYVCQTALVLQRLKLCQHYQHIHETYYTGYNNYTYWLLHCLTPRTATTTTTTTTTKVLNYSDASLKLQGHFTHQI